MKNKDHLLDTVEDVDFFLDRNDPEAYYAEFVDGNGCKVFTSIDSHRFKSFLYVKSYEDTDGEDALETTTSVKNLKYWLNHYKCYQKVDIHIRTAGNLKDGIEYDLQSNEQKSVKVTEEGWEISEKSKKFVITNTSLPQVTPIKTDKSPLELLKPFVNVKGDTLILFVVWLIQAFTKGTHHALLVLADKGSGKTSLTKIIKSVIDPCEYDVVAIPGKKDDLFTLLNNSFLCCLDNVSRISDDISDIFCGATTGMSAVKRSLYTNNDLNVTKLHNTIVINGIDIVPGKEDLAERMMLLKLKKLTSSELKTDENIWDGFDKALPEILGSIFNTLSLAMNVIKNINEANMPRMASSFIEMIAIAKALGIDEDDFRRMYNDNKEQLNQERCPSIVGAVKEFMPKIKGRKVEDTAEAMFQNIRDAYSGDKTQLPNSASQFSRKLEEYHVDLLKAGYRVNIDDTGSKNTIVAIIKRKKKHN